MTRGRPDSPSGDAFGAVQGNQRQEDEMKEKIHAPLLQPVTQPSLGHMAARFAGLLLVVLALMLTMHGRGSVAGAAQPVSAPPIHVEVQRGAMTVDVRGVPLADLLRVVGERAALTVSIHGGDSPLVTDSFTDLPLDEGIKRLVRGNGLVLTYAPSQGRARVSVLKEVRVYLTPPQAPGPAAANGTKPPSPASRVEPKRSAGLRDVRTLARQRDEASAAALTQIVAQDPDPVVRAKAVAALGKFGGTEAAMALSRALMDQDPSVRIQAARALGRVESDQVTPALAGVLTSDPDPRVRKEAVRTLATLGTDQARWSLEAAALDADPSVRRAVASALAKWGKRRAPTQ